ncbi:RAS oncogene family member Rab26 isoform X1 [Musca autumnalis]|uniref:RAS oncogene family member Rab26 isoform X1 n=1 Tax=Musca autumnalis TaxID=221902 RepID=UPI003CF0E734
MSRAFKNRRNRPDSVRIPAVPNLSKHPIMLARSSSTGPPCSGATTKALTLRKSSSITAPTTPVSKKKTLDKIPSISAQSESSEEEDEEEEKEEDKEGNGKQKNHFFNNNVTTTTATRNHVSNTGDNDNESKVVEEQEEDDDDDDDDDGILHKRVSVIAHEYPNNINWSPGGGGGVIGIVDGVGVGVGSSTNAKNISTKMACGLRMCKATGRNFIKMLSTSNGHSTSSSSAGKFGSQTKPLANIATANNENRHDILSKVIMLGDSGVGKTSLLIMFRDGVYMPCYYVTTVGIDFMNKVVVVDGTRVKLQIWDTAGQERFRSVTHAYYRDAHALLLLYDVTNKTTYDNIRAWLCEIRDCAQEDVVIVLIGNKADCSSSDRQVKREDGERLAREHNVPFMETSAKTGLNVELAFQTVARQLKSRGYDQNDGGKFNVHDFVRDNTKAKSICAQCNF